MTYSKSCHIVYEFCQYLSPRPLVFAEPHKLRRIESRVDRISVEGAYIMDEIPQQNQRNE